VYCTCPLTSATTADKIHKTTYDTTPSREAQAEPNPFGTRKRHAKMDKCKPRPGSLQLRTHYTSMVKGWPSSKRTLW
jgi:hypothetical protein